MKLWTHTTSALGQGPAMVSKFCMTGIPMFAKTLVAQALCYFRIVIKIRPMAHVQAKANPA